MGTGRFLDQDPPGEVPAAFAAAMDDDLGTPQAMAVLFNTVREGNQALQAGDRAAVGAALDAVVAMLDVLGLDAASPEWVGAGGSEEFEAALGTFAQELLRQRAQARADKDWARADAIRAVFAAAGLKIEDTKDGARWSLERG